LDPNAEIILSACLTGGDHGFAEKVNETYDRRVIATDQLNSGLASFSVGKRPDGGVRFNVVFSSTSDPTYNTGKKGTVIFEPKNKGEAHT